MPFFIIFVLIPLAEILVFIAVSDHIGLGTALLMALMTAIIGGALVRYQGIATIFSAQDSLRRGEIPSRQLFDGLCLVAAGAMLITPGFITDTLGFLLLIPAVRHVLLRMLVKSGRVSVNGFNAEYAEFHDQRHYHHPGEPDVIDVEFETIEKDDAQTDEDSPS